jgi:uncharacterized protein (TIGR00299 family) protein
MQLHLDPLGGIAGDMFIGAMLDAFPDLEAGTLASIYRVLPDGVACRQRRHRDGLLQGAGFDVDVTAPGPSDGVHRHAPASHGHASWRAIRARIERSGLDADVMRNAIGIFGLLAEAEGRVHGVDPESVGFHEVGAADSIADIVGAAYIIATLGAVHWSVAPLPLGSGRVETAHGTMPVPAPATALLLEGFPTLDDGIAGERVTPTGAAILRWLGAAAGHRDGARVLARSGIGFGTKSFPGVSNCLRVLVFEDAVLPSTVGSGDAASRHRELAVIEFEVDDQTAEDLATGLDRLRAAPGVFDVLQMPAFGKKGRMTAHVQLLASVAALEDIIAACFRETTTIGLRHRIVEGRALPRRVATVEIAGQTVRVKTVERPGGQTAKAEGDDLARAGDQAGRARLRLAAEQGGLAAEPAAAVRDTAPVVTSA